MVGCTELVLHTQQKKFLFNNNNNFRVMFGEQQGDTKFKHNISPIFYESQS